MTNQGTGIDINRRNAFAASFNQYPTVLEQFATNNAFLKYPITGEERAPKETEIHAIMQICMAQFCVRLIQTRARGATDAMQEFAKGAVDRYHAYHRELLGGLAIQAPANYRTALMHIEQGMADVIFHALASEAAMIDQAQSLHASMAKAKEEGHIDHDISPYPDDFNEGGFWRDVFLALTMNQRRSHPRWVEPVQGIILNHFDQFQMALDPE